MDDDVLNGLYAPATETPGGSMADLMLGEWDAAADEHLCALCGHPIEDPMEECPTCASSIEGDEGT